MSPRASERLTELHKWITVIFLPVIAYFAIKLDRKLDSAYDSVNRHEQMWVAQNRINEAVANELHGHELEIKDLTRLYITAVRDNSRAVN
jgi:hypothetical protein